MKVRVSATIDEETAKIIEVLVQERKFRNKSHVIEEAVRILHEKNKK